MGVIFRSICIRKESEFLKFILFYGWMGIDDKGKGELEVGGGRREKQCTV